jgi:hypothetical protein
MHVYVRASRRGLPSLPVALTGRIRPVMRLTGAGLAALGQTEHAISSALGIPHVEAPHVERYDSARSPGAFDFDLILSDGLVAGRTSPAIT